ncbi:MAG: single-stranded DNA-binding protein [Treponema sp.]|uniref:single-stranded DNA-binding protein n=1 Tax=Treponema sp. TaxID=166 RepID=UPI00298E42E3|nr:single-stranded DNA-binding protein [Treponema sp.]MBR5932357.1 single-stranded DNA-binding protein [Treponema sp.]
MNNINCLIVEGNITQNVEFKTTAHGYPVCRLPIAVNHYYKKANSDEFVDEVSYFDVETFGKLAEICAKFSQKGRGVSVIGRIKQNRWKTDDGKNASRVTIIAEKVEFKPRLNGNNDSEVAVDENIDSKELEEKKNLAMQALEKTKEDSETTVF